MTVVRYDFVPTPPKCRIWFSSNPNPLQFTYTDPEVGIVDCTQKIAISLLPPSGSSASLTPEELQQVEDLGILYSDFIWSGLLSTVTVVFALSLLLKMINGIFKT